MASPDMSLMVAKAHEHAKVFCDKVGDLPTTEQISEAFDNDGYVIFTADRPKRGWVYGYAYNSKLPSTSDLKRVVYVIPKSTKDLGGFRLKPSIEKLPDVFKSALIVFITSDVRSPRYVYRYLMSDHIVISPLAVLLDTETTRGINGPIHKVVTVDEYFNKYRQVFDPESLPKINLSDPGLCWICAIPGDIIMVTGHDEMMFNIVMDDSTVDNSDIKVAVDFEG